MLTKVLFISIMNIVLIQRTQYARVAQWWSIALPRRGSRVRIPSRAFLLAGISLIYKGFQPFVLSLCFIMDRNPAAMKGSGSSKLKVSGYKIFLLSRLDFPG